MYNYFKETVFRSCDYVRFETLPDCFQLSEFNSDVCTANEDDSEVDTESPFSETKRSAGICNIVT